MAHMQWRLRTALLCAALKCCFSLTAPVAGRGASRSSKRAAAAAEPPATPLPTGATAESRILDVEGRSAKTENGLLSAEIPLANLLARAPRQLQTYWARNWARLAILGCALT